MKTSSRVRPMPGEQLVEQLPGLADEREALLVLVEAGRLADEHQLGVGVPDAEDDLRAALRERGSACSRRRARRTRRGVPDAQCPQPQLPPQQPPPTARPPKLGCSAVP